MSDELKEEIRWRMKRITDEFGDDIERCIDNSKLERLYSPRGSKSREYWDAVILKFEAMKEEVKDQ